MSKGPTEADAIQAVLQTLRADYQTEDALAGAIVALLFDGVVGLNRPLCRVDDCPKKARIRAYCQYHYGKWRRYGDPTGTRIGGRRASTTYGYRESIANGHPLGWKNGAVAEHRRVLYDLIGAGPHPCHWCQEPVTWTAVKGNGKLYVDHLDENRLNNDPENLAPTCMQCNIQRGRKGRRSAVQTRRRKTECQNGHALTPDNVYWSREGYRRCKTCVNQYQREWQRKRKALQM